MFVHSTVDVEVSYHPLRRVLLEAQSWLGHLLPAAVREALDHAGRRGAAFERDLLERVDGAIRCDLGRPRVDLDTTSLPMRWRSDLDAGVFPRVADGELRVSAVDRCTSRLALDVMYFAPRDIAGSACFHLAVAAATDGYLIAIAAML